MDVDDETLGLLAVAAAVSLGAHARERRYLRACLIAAALCPFVYALVALARRPGCLVALLGWSP